MNFKVSEQSLVNTSIYIYNNLISNFFVTGPTFAFRRSKPLWKWSAGDARDPTGLSISFSTENGSYPILHFNEGAQPKQKKADEEEW